MERGRKCGYLLVLHLIITEFRSRWKNLLPGNGGLNPNHELVDQGGISDLLELSFADELQEVMGDPQAFYAIRAIRVLCY